MTTLIQDRMRMTVLPPRTFRPRRYRPGNLGTWSGHLPFACDLIAAFRPSLIVELGTHYGESYFGMCQAVQENALSSMCYAVDTWKGDPHANFYDESVFEEVNAYNEENYASFSKLLRTTFDAARENFGDGTIDLLHIDGLHTYDAVRHDFDGWFPKVRPGGVVLLHDTAARHMDLQVWRLWEELADQFPHFEFTHAWGLGVLRKPGGPAPDSEFVETIFSSSPAERDFLRHYYASQAEVLERAELMRRMSSRAALARFQVFPHLVDGYTEGTSIVAMVKLGEWQDLVLVLPQGSAHGRIRVDPADRPCLIELASVQLRREQGGSVLKSWTDASAMKAFTLTNLARLPGESVRFMSTGLDPHFLLPEIDPALTDQSLVLDARVRIDEDLSSAVALLQSSVSGDDAVRLETTAAEREAVLIRNQQLSAEIRNLQAERVALVAEYRRVHALNESLLNERASLNSRLASEQEALKEELNVVYRSRSWRLTAPLRRLLRNIR